MERPDGQTDPMPERHVSGSMTLSLVQYLQSHTAAGIVEEVLSRAGEERTLETLCDVTSWSSYWQFRRLLESTASLLDGLETVFDAGANVRAVATEIASSTDMLQSFNIRPVFTPRSATPPGW